MASFFGHLCGGVVVSAAAALVVDSRGWASPELLQVLFVLGVVGGLLPDIDSENSTPARLLFRLLGIAAAFAVSFSSAAGDLQLVERVLLWGAVYLSVRFALFEVFARFTVHRGIWHSWFALAFAGLATANATYHLAAFSPWDAWLAGFFVAIGYLTHLCLDEIASFDLQNNRVRRSLGTALKPFSFGDPLASAAMFLSIVVLAGLSPTIEPVVAVASGLHGGGLPFSFQFAP